MKAITLLVLATLSSTAGADNLDDFKDAVTRKGCDENCKKERP